MDRRRFIQQLGMGAAAMAAPAPSAQDKPNIVYILADDMGYGDPRAYNQDSRIPTPHMDRLAREGIRFTDCHSPSAVCTPTRYGILTGRYSWRTSLKEGVLWGYSPSLIDPGRLTVASLLKEQGYRTGCVGKWHLGLGNQAKTDYSQRLKPGPNDFGFDYFFGIPASLDMEPYLYIENDRAVEQPTETIQASKKGEGGFWRAGPIAPGFKHKEVLPTLTEKACGFLRRHAKQAADQPFFLYFPLTAPHTPWAPIDSFKGRSRAGDYGDFVAQVDASIGQVMGVLDEMKLRDNTLLMVTSDNGAHWTQEDIRTHRHLANNGWRGQKADIWEGGHRIPFFARWPGKIKAETTTDETACLTDLLATCAAILGVRLPETAGEDSYNLLPAILGTKADKPIREATVHHSISGVFSIRQQRWKLILGRGSGGFTDPRVIEPKPGEPKGQLYDLAKDPAEKENLYLERPDVVERLTALLEKYERDGRSRPL